MKKYVLFLAIILLGLLPGCTIDFPESAPAASQVSGSLTVYYLDVGQADCTLVQLPDQKTMLIDAGNNSDGLLIADFLKKQEISTIDYMVLTHPHEDHIGGADVIIRSFGVGEVYMPRIKDSLVPTTQTYEEVLDALEEKEVQVNAAVNGMQILQNGSLSVSCLSPYGDYSDLNHYSVVVRLDYGEASFLFTGDAEEKNEREMIANRVELDVDILKVGHHGSNYSSCREFLQATSPQYAIISVGAKNRYGHPSDAAINRFYDYGTEMVYRTDLNGTVIVETDGVNFTVRTDNNIMLDGSR